MIIFSCCFQDVFKIFGFWKSNYNVFSYRFLWIYSTMSTLSILMCRLTFFIKVWLSLVIVSSNFFLLLFLSPPGIFNMNELVHKSPRLSSVFYLFIYLFCCSSVWIISIDLLSVLLILYSVCLSVLLSPLCIIFHISYYTFQLLNYYINF